MGDTHAATILVVDDTPTNLGVLFQTLRDAAYTTLLAQSGARALALVAEAEPDLVLLDVRMPGLDGFEVCRRLKANPKTVAIPVIFLTVLDDTQSKVRGFDVGGVDYLTKPIEPAELLARLNTHLTIRNLQRQLQRQQQALAQALEERTLALERALAEQRLLRQGQTDGQAHWQPQTLPDERKQPDQQAALARQIQPGLAALSRLLSEPDGQGTSEALRIVHELEQHIAQSAVPLARPGPDTPGQEHPLIQLSAREQEVLHLLAAGKETGEIAVLLGVADNTVRVYRSRLMHKLDLHDLPSLVKFALKHHLISLE
ncbi:MAG TPA: response regulator transcription factor [Roseiflexaceae bacterium]|nr:response regulator transcription factor [Roseiflexaceae bacterium]